MNSLIRQFFQPGRQKESNFFDVLFLNDHSHAKWEEISEKAPHMPRGWFELSRVSPIDRVEFTRDFWLDRLPFYPATHPAFYEFFNQLDDVVVVLTREEKEEFWDAELVYSLEDNSSFFRGQPPCSEANLAELKNEIGASLPRDYLAFKKIHNGFGKLSEMGLLEIGELADARRRVMELLLGSDHLLKSGSMTVDPSSLIPFYEAFGLASYQCFFTDWYPGSEMGNVYLSGIDYTISDLNANSENLAFNTFLEWLTYYLQGMNLSP